MAEGRGTARFVAINEVARALRRAAKIARGSVDYLNGIILLLAFSASRGMISGFMSPNTQPPESEGAKREADIYDLLAWLEVNKVKAGIIVALLVVAGLVIATVRYVKQEKEAKASSELLALKPALSPQTNVPPAQPAAFLKVADQFAGTRAAERAHIFAATAFFTEGKYSDAEREFSQFVKDFPDSPWVAEADYGIAASLEAQNKLKEAQAGYQHVATAYPDSSVADDAKLSLARVYNLEKQPDQALRLYNELLTPRPGAPPGELGNREAYERKEALLRANPNLNTNNIPPVRVLAPAPSMTTSSNRVQPVSTLTNAGGASKETTNQGGKANPAQIRELRPTPPGSPSPAAPRK
jgi:tetratricopeptide (TPR) repeat protein